MSIEAELKHARDVAFDYDRPQRDRVAAAQEYLDLIFGKKRIIRGKRGR